MLLFSVKDSRKPDPPSPSSPSGHRDSERDARLVVCTNCDGMRRRGNAACPECEGDRYRLYAALRAEVLNAGAKALAGELAGAWKGEA